MKSVFAILAVTFAFLSCKKDEPDVVQTPNPAPNLVFQFKFDSTQARLDNLGNPSTIPSGSSGISPDFREMSTHYIELSPGQFTPLGGGEIVYLGEETAAGGDTAVDFSKANIGTQMNPFYSIPLSEVSPGSYEWVRSSLTFQKYDIPVRHVDGGNTYNLTGTLASFVGYNTYIETIDVDQQQHTVNDDKLQGYWVFETHPVWGVTIPLSSGQAPPGATTVPNPIFATSPVPQGSCVVTGQFAQPLVITGNETEDIVITLSVSTNKSFEFIDSAGDGVFEPAAEDTVTDMGVRGLIPYVNL